MKSTLFKSKFIILTGAIAFSLLATTVTILAQNTTPSPPPVENEVTEKSLLDLYKQGGPLMHFILLCSIGTIAVGVYCGIQINGKKMALHTLRMIESCLIRI